MFRGRSHLLALNQQVVLSNVAMTITVLTPNQRPSEVTFEFAKPLDDDSLRWFYWHRGEYQPFIVPTVGQTVVVHQW